MSYTSLYSQDEKEAPEFPSAVVSVHELFYKDKTLIMINTQTELFFYSLSILNTDHVNSRTQKKFILTREFKNDRIGTDGKIVSYVYQTEKTQRLFLGCS